MRLGVIAGPGLPNSVGHPDSSQTKAKSSSSVTPILDSVTTPPHMDDDDPSTPVSTFKKRNKTRPSGSTSSLRPNASAPPSALSFGLDDGDDGDDDDSGNVAVIKQRKKKTPAGVVRSRESLGAGKSRLSFGGEGVSPTRSQRKLVCG